MKRKLLCLFLFCCCMLSGVRGKDLARYVNPFIGTGAVANSLSGNNYPGATVPFGMVQLSPDTNEAPDWAQASGYDYNDTSLYGFSHTRLSGTGASDLIDILLLPMTQERRKAAFSHTRESAAAGYYRVMLPEDSILAELTATTHTGMHRYTYYSHDDAKIFLDMDHSAGKGSWGRRILQSQIRQVSTTAVEGYRVITGWAKIRKIYFYMEFSAPILHNEMINGGERLQNISVVNGTELKAIFEFGKVREIVCRVAISPVSIENAKENMAAEVDGASFDEVMEQAYSLWNRELNKIVIDADEEEMMLFYTALYHTMIQPNTFSDVNGEYMAADYSVRNLKQDDGIHYTTFSLWDTFRAAHPLYTLIEPERSADFVRSMLRQYSCYGYLPIWQLWGQDNYCMIGNHAVPVVVDAVLKGIPGVDAEEVYEAVKGSLAASHLNSPFEVWDSYGYMPEDVQTQSVSITLEQCFDDWCAAQLAKYLNREDDYNFFMKRAGYYVNLYHAGTKFFQPKNAAGEWILPFDPYKYGANGGNPFTEGNAWQYYWYVPHDIPNLIALTGGERAFCKKLDEFFTSSVSSGAKNDNASGFIGLYVHGNEPDHHAAYLYALAGEAAKTQQLTDYIKRNMYNTTSAGYAGNDDCGEMSAWYIFSVLGFYPVNPASGEFVVGSPSVQNAVINLGGGKEFNINVKRKGKEDIYVKSIHLNGKKMEGHILDYNDIKEGGTLDFVMSAKPQGKILTLSQK